MKTAYEDGCCIRPVLLHPENCGRLELRSADPQENVKVFQNFFSVNNDLVKFCEGVRMARRVTVQAQLSPYRGDEINPGVHVDSDDAIDDWIRETMVTAHHPACTCAMGVGELSVLNPDMTVKGAQSLRVVDASAMPDLTSGNINAPVLMMAEKASDMILGNFSTG
ncbi:MAG: GMC oxidoreductase [Pseudomonadota bacterium]|nr:GMC oxidoreductase [Pseudomonadota bacterium]